MFLLLRSFFNLMQALTIINSLHPQNHTCSLNALLSSHALHRNAAVLPHRIRGGSGVLGINIHYPSHPSNKNKTKKRYALTSPLTSRGKKRKAKTFIRFHISPKCVIFTFCYCRCCFLFFSLSAWGDRVVRPDTT
ncbi:hypothetical protein, unlikely [Trypanosoma congolense IL3000]|uniref:Uncharacterized protein n=1 Tax=Trypanosoma congolense (strain IL3000) TaxID=1068625 RepID=F9WF54_TRYCI|nr:hypothetical protein, unlikely [Trypanosoma congolense IL3000]